MKRVAVALLLTTASSLKVTVNKTDLPWWSDGSGYKKMTAKERQEACKQNCAWKCDSPVCNQACKPVCKAPKCVTTCKKPSVASCQRVCAQAPKCAVICPATTCKDGNACPPPNCDTVCGQQECHLDCGQTQGCFSQCNAPACDFQCSAPTDCKKPNCEMKCQDIPKWCHEVPESNRLAVRNDGKTVGFGWSYGDNGYEQTTSSGEAMQMPFNGDPALQRRGEVVWKGVGKVPADMLAGSKKRDVTDDIPLESSMPGAETATKAQKGSKKGPVGPPALGRKRAHQEVLQESSAEVPINSD
eukprot:TRINITY_DN10515_c4_g1_i1.p1 TRINITY_DN10515_c4_g1~~TRINITY_DN10515_c4_g1_i1.p1  ORF type:complete len:300 (+),score=78.88 TRINITY_DN10515_c4_g1_i1:138-1037(+)